MKRLLIACLALSSLSLNAANYFVRPSAQGAGNGSDWNNAWSLSSLNANWSSVANGDTVWLAGGNYSTPIYPSKNASSSSRIYIKRALASDAVPTSALGWQGSFDSAVTIQTSTGVFDLTQGGGGSYFTLDGRTWAGITLWSPYGSGWDSRPFYSRNGAQGVQVLNCVLRSDGLSGQSQTACVLIDGSVGSAGILFSNCWIYNSPQAITLINGASNITFDHCKIGPIDASLPAHSNMIEMNSTGNNNVWRYCEFTQWTVVGFMFWNGSGSVAIYGCYIHDADQDFLWPSGTGESTAGPILLYNNTFVNAPVSIGRDNTVKFASGSASRNNIYWNSDGVSTVISDCNYDFSNGSTPGANSISSGANPFVNLAARDVHIVSTVSANLPRNKGVDLGSSYNKDIDGFMRGEDGAWDIGAYEYYSGSVNTNPPVFDVVPINQTAVANVTVFFVSHANGGGNLQYQWMHEGTNLPNGTVAVLQLSNVSSNEAGTYQVSVSSVYGFDISQPVTLDVVYAPFVVEQPRSGTLKLGDSTNIWFNVGGEAPIAFQWKHAGTNLVGEIASNLTIVSADTTKAGSYTCLASNLYGTLLSAASVITVVTGATITVEPPTSTEVVLGQPLSISLTAVGTAPLSYWWQHAGTNLPGATLSTYSKAVSALTDAGSYYAFVSNSIGKDTSTLAIVVVHVPPTIDTQPVGATLAEGESTNFTVSASGDAVLTYQWRKNGTNLVGETTSTLARNTVTTNDAGSYRVVVTNPYGSVTSSAAPLIVTIAGEPPVCLGVRVSPTNSITVGSSVLFTVSAIGDPTLHFQWDKDGGDITDATNTTYTIASVALADQGVYTCTITNDYGTNSCFVTLTNVFALPTLTVEPSDQSVNVGNPFTLTSGGVGSYQWYKFGFPVDGETNATLSVAAATKLDEGTYWLKVYNQVGETNSQQVRVSVCASPLIVTVTPSGNLGLNTGVTFVPTINDGDGPFNYTWTKGGISIPGANQSTYTISSLRYTDSGTYQLVVINACGFPSTMPFSITVVGAPVVTIAGTNSITKLAGDTLSLSGSATGVGITTYIWLKNGVALANDYRISGASTPNLLITHLLPGDSGNYSLEAVSPYGNGISDPVALSVLYGYTVKVGIRAETTP